jgi:hypothetical protein
VAADTAPAPRARRPVGPPLLAPAAAFVALFLAGLAVPTLLAGGAPFPSPFAPAASSLEHFARHPGALRAGALFQFCAAAPLGAFAAGSARRLGARGRRAPGTALALYGGLAAAFFLALSALAQWALAQPEALDPPGAARALHLVAFAAGGPGHVAPLGLLAGALARGAGRAGLVPKGAAIFGLVPAALAGLATLGLAAPPLLYLLPLARFSALGYLLYAGAALSAPRPRRRPKGKRSPL